MTEDGALSRSTKAISVLSCGCTVSPERYALQWRVGSSVRSVTCKCTAGEASPEYVHGGEGEPQWSRVVSCTCEAPEAWTGCWAPLGLGSREWGGTQMVNVNTCGAKAGEICRGPW